jgi:hypothetical protein
MLKNGIEISLDCPFKGTVARDIQPRVFYLNWLHMDTEDFLFKFADIFGQEKELAMSGTVLIRHL